MSYLTNLAGDLAEYYEAMFLERALGSYEAKRYIAFTRTATYKLMVISAKDQNKHHGRPITDLRTKGGRFWRDMYPQNYGRFCREYDAEHGHDKPKTKGLFR